MTASWNEPLDPCGVLVPPLATQLHPEDIGLESRALGGESRGFMDIKALSVLEDTGKMSFY